MENIRKIIQSSCIIATLLFTIAGCTLEPSQETIELQEMLGPESELPIIDEVYRPSVRDEVYSPTQDEILTP
ncbi:hypothetical protein [Paenibacillus sp. Marseille-Q4541]|uniref:hypothetical protein n=1 Tax=Paenibacillus sp. Marseille-Q4541 TaxID=2831522 RepID=UPI001BA9B1DC|nr:hypothetical protein [Paenibacillus sp. Marseille-Q4541]